MARSTRWSDRACPHRVTAASRTCSSARGLGVRGDGSSLIPLGSGARCVLSDPRRRGACASRRGLGHDETMPCSASASDRRGKGFDYLDRRPAARAGTQPRLRLVIAGDGDIASALVQQVDRLGLPARSRSSDALARQDVPAYLREQPTSSPSRRFSTSRIRRRPRLSSARSDGRRARRSSRQGVGGTCLRDASVTATADTPRQRARSAAAGGCAS